MSSSAPQSPRVAYLVTRFPKTTETFIYREVDELLRRNEEVSLYALHRDTGMVQPESERIAPDVRYPKRRGGLVGDLGYWIVRRPLVLARLFGQVTWGNRSSPAFLVKALIAVVQGASLARFAEAEPIDVVHAHFATHGAVAAMAIARLRDIEWSTTIHAHDLYANTSMLAEKARDASGVVTISHFNQRLLADEFGCPNTTLVRYGVDIDRYDFVPPTTVTDPWHILSVGRLSGLKGHPYLLRACRELMDAGHNIQCTIAGDGPDEAALRALAAQLGIIDVVEFLGAVSGGRVEELLRDADCFALACDIEADGTMDGLPNALIEALAIGLPTVSTAVSGIPELIRDEDTALLVSPRDPSALARAIARLCEDDDLRARVAVNGRNLVEAEYDIRKSVDDMQRFFADLVKR